MLQRMAADCAGHLVLGKDAEPRDAAYRRDVISIVVAYVGFANGGCGHVD